jgi:hypothetical protein
MHEVEETNTLYFSFLVVLQLTTVQRIIISHSCSHVQSQVVHMDTHVVLVSRFASH